MENSPLEITPTPSMLQGFGGVWQCNNCGLLAAVPGGGKAHTRERLAGCPSCDIGHGWSRQPFDVGPFQKVYARYLKAYTYIRLKKLGVPVWST